MEQKPMNIKVFKKGDIITRIEPSAPLPGFGGDFDGNDDDLRDRAYIGAPMKFLGVANGCVNIERYEVDKKSDDEYSMPALGGFFKMMMGQAGPIHLPVDIWGDGWSFYIDPYSDKPINKLKSFPSENFLTMEDHLWELSESKEELEIQLQEAIEKEDYLNAERIKGKLNNMA